MFDNLSEKLGGILDRLTGRGALSEADVDAAMREIRRALLEAGTPMLVIDTTAEVLAPLREQGVETITGNVTDKEVIGAANLEAARCLLVAVPDAFEGGYAVELGHKANPSLKIIARSHSEEETAHLVKHGATEVVMGEYEIAKAMIAGLPPSMTPAAGPAVQSVEPMVDTPPVVASRPDAEAAAAADIALDGKPATS